MTTWETVIGLECHVELSTKTKMFCGCLNEFGAPPNTNVCAVCLGHPGSLPVPNREAIASIIKIGLALDGEIAPHSLFHRKNYFYPDMPKNYQISQYDLPICVGGHVDIELPDGTTKRIGITRVHMEEDTGKTMHTGATGRIHGAESALIDYNRAGVPLVECVSEPDMRSPEEAAAYLRELRATLEALDVSDVRMEEGSLRCDANISIRPEGSDTLGTKVEIKNMNSVRSLERALTYERERQIDALEDGKPLVQETRHWDEDTGVTTSMRSKEEAFDYRYFPEPDIPALEPWNEWIEEIRATLPELPRSRSSRYETEFGLPGQLAWAIASSRELSRFFDEAANSVEGPAWDSFDEQVSRVRIANWITQDFAGLLNASGVELEQSKIIPQHIADIVRLIESGSVSGPGAKQALEEAFDTGEAIETIVDKKGLRQVSDAASLSVFADEVIAENPDVVEKFRSGNDNVVGFLVGQFMKKAGSAANPKVAQELLRERLK